MSNPLTSHGLRCCDDFRGLDPFIHPCECPRVRLVTKAYTRTYQLQGFSEYTDPSTPPKKYLLETHSLNTTGPVGGTISGSGTKVGSFDEGDGDFEIERSYTYSFSDGGCREELPCTTTTVTRNFKFDTLPIGSCGLGGGTNPPCTADVDGYLSHATTTTKTTLNKNYDGTDPDASGSNTNTLSDENTEAATEDRKDLIEGTAEYRSEGSTRYETRTTGFSWAKNELKYCLVFLDLKPGVTYEGEMPVASTTAVEGESFPGWTEEPYISFSFTASDVFHIEGGSLAVTVEEFKEQSYDDNPAEYGLPSGTDVIQPNTDLEIVKGKVIRIGQFDPSFTTQLYVKPE